MKGMVDTGLAPRQFLGPFWNPKHQGLCKSAKTGPDRTHEKPGPALVEKLWNILFYSEQKHFAGKSILIPRSPRR